MQIPRPYLVSIRRDVNERVCRCIVWTSNPECGGPAAAKKLGLEGGIIDEDYRIVEATSKIQEELKAANAPVFFL